MCIKNRVVAIKKNISEMQQPLLCEYYSKKKGALSTPKGWDKTPFWHFSFTQEANWSCCAGLRRVLTGCAKVLMLQGAEPHLRRAGSIAN